MNCQGDLTKGLIVWLNLHGTGLKVWSDCMRNVWTQIGRIAYQHKAFMWDRSGPQVYPIFKNPMGMFRFLYNLAACSGPKPLLCCSCCAVPCLHGSPVWVMCVGSTTGMNQADLRWFFILASCKQKQSLVWGPIWSWTMSLSSYQPHVIRALHWLL